MGIREYAITGENLVKFLRHINDRKTLIAPAKNEFSDVLLLPVSDVTNICFDYENTSNCARDYLLPDAETVFESGPSHDSITAAKRPEEFVLFGIRPCDVKAVSLLDRFFARTFEDNLYFDKRKKATIVAFGCERLCQDSFCTETKTGPFLDPARDEFDMQLIPVNGRYVVQVGSDKGLALWEDSRTYFEDITEKDKGKARDTIHRAVRQELRFNLKDVYEKLKSGKAGEDIWKDIASRCQSCGLCLFICPTCSCFTVNDGNIRPDGKMKRARQRDACYFRGFTRLSGGHNPVIGQAEMIKRKYMHKLVQQIDEFQMSGCVGCGRCNKVCVGNVDWLENIIKMQGKP